MDDIERMAREAFPASALATGSVAGPEDGFYIDIDSDEARAFCANLAALVRAATLEEAAAVIESFPRLISGADLAAEIRALKTP